MSFATFDAGLAAYAEWPTPNIPPVTAVNFIPVKKTMRPFRSDQELVSYFKELAAKQKLRQRGEFGAGNAQPSAPTASVAKESADATKVATEKDESITNTQHAGVDEGGIVK